NQVVTAAKGVPGVATAVPYPAGGAPTVAGGLARGDATLGVRADSAEATDVVDRLRARAHAIAGADAKGGGATALTAGLQRTSRRDRWIVVPLVLVVVFAILSLLVRAVLAASLLVLTVVLSFLATLGVSAVMFRNVFGFAGVDPSFPLFAFVLVVA